MSRAAAFFVGMATGAGVAVLMTLWIAWSMRNSPHRQRRRRGIVMLVAMIAVPLGLAFAMPNFKTALLAWIGFPVGYACSTLLTLPLAHLLGRRIERRTR